MKQKLFAKIIKPLILTVVIFGSFFVSNFALTASAACSATGGTTTTSGLYTIHTFTTVGNSTFTVTGNCNVEALVVAGGGAGGGYVGGGGGAGGLISTSSYSVSGAITVTVGAGGTAPVGNSTTAGTNGGDSVFGTLNAIGGGRGSIGGGANQWYATGGGSGGGAGAVSSGSVTGGSGTTNQGYAGGNAYLSGGNYPGGGGGGAGAVGVTPASNTANGGNGGAGLQYPQFASVGGSPAGWFAGGGGGAVAEKTPGSGGSGGGGLGAIHRFSDGQSTASGSAGVNGTGGGGGGGNPAGTSAGGYAGGSGIVIVRYLTDSTAPIVSVTSPTNGSSYATTSVSFTASQSDTNPGFLVPNLDNSLVSWWQMDNNAVSTAVTDYMGANAGTAARNTSLLSTTTAHTNRALNFNGSSDKVSLSPMPLYSEFTQSAWVYARSLPGNQNYIFTNQKNPPSSGYYTYQQRQGSYVNSGGALVFQYWTDSGGSGCNSSASVIQPGQWYFIACKAGSGGASCYVNNNLVCTSAPAPSTSITPTQAFIGWRGDPQGNDPWNGYIDDVLIHSKALTTDEITALYNGTAISHNSTLTAGSHTYKAYSSDLSGNVGVSATSTFIVDTTAPTVTVTSPTDSGVYGSSVSFAASQSDTNPGFLVPNLDSSLVSWYQMDNNAASTAVTDYMGANAGTAARNTSLFSTSTGHTNSALSFNGTSDYININNSSSLNPTTTMSYSVWFRPTANANNYYTVLIKPFVGSVGGNEQYFLQRDGVTGQITAGMKINGAMKYAKGGSWTAIQNVWTHAVATYDGSNLKLYVNNSLIATTPATGLLNTDTASLGIGGESGGNFTKFPGSIDDVMIYNNALTADEVTALYNGTAISHNSTLTSGSHTYKAYSSDLAGNVGSSSLSTFTVDTTAPTVTITSPTNGSSYSTTSVSFTASQSDTNPGFLVPNLDNSLVSWWQMDNNTANTTVTDFMGVNAGVAQRNTSLFSTTTGHTNNALSFNGTSDWISVPDSNSLTPTGGLALSAWVKNTGNGSGNGYATIIGKYKSDNTNREYYFALDCLNDGDNIFDAIIYDQTNNSYIGRRQITGNNGVAACDGNWHHIVATWDGGTSSTGIKMYDNTNIITTTDLSAGSFSTLRNGSSVVQIGLSSWSSVYWKGLIDDPMIFNGPLTTDEITALYNGTAISHTSTLTAGSHTYKAYSSDLAGNVGSSSLSTFTVDMTAPTVTVTSPTNGTTYNNTSVSFTASQSDTNPGFLVPNLDSGLMGWWQMDNNAANTTVTDYLGINNGTATQNTSVMTTTGHTNRAIDFNGNTDYISVGNSFGSFNDGFTPFSFSAWVKTNGAGTGNGSTIMSKQGNVWCAAPGYTFGTSGGKLYTYLWHHACNGQTITVESTNSVVSDAAWVYVTMTYSGSGLASGVKLYVNGQLVPMTVVNDGLAGLDIASSDPFRIGFAGGGDWKYPFKGAIDDAMVFNKVLTTDEITALYNGTAINHSSTLTLGSHTYKVYSSDLAGNVSSSSLSTFTVTNPATCGAATDDPLYTVCKYTNDGTFTPPSGVTSVSALIVAGGGGGGYNWAGGGGAGGLISTSSYAVSGTTTITVGGGGNGGTSVNGSNGGNSVFGTLTAIGGGGGGGSAGGGGNGNTGGSGGGGQVVNGSGAAGTSGQGYAGGNSTGTWSLPYYKGAGGGGAGGAGSNGGSSGGTGNGGSGVSSSISGSSVCYAGGGGGGGSISYSLIPGSATCGGGRGSGLGYANATPGTDGTGGGGGGGNDANNNAVGGKGGSGVVIVRYLTPLGNGLVAHYKMNDNLSTTNVIENKGGNNGTAVRNTSAMYVAGKVNGALNFNGTSDKISIPGASALNFGTGDFTISFWTKPTNANTYQDFIGTDANNTLMLSIGNTVDTKIWIGRNNVAFDTSFTNTLTSGVWKHLLIKRVDGYISLYVNGSLVDSPVANSLSYNFNTLIIGSIPQYGNWYGGSMDDVRIYNRALSQAEITALYNWGDGTEDDGSAAITVSATGAQISTTTIPVTGQNLGGAFLLTSTLANATTTSIRLKNTGSLSTSTIANIVLAYKNAVGGQCSSTKPSGTTSFGTAGAVDANGFTTTTGTIPLNKDVPVCVYVNYNLTGSFSTSSLGNSIDFEINNPSADIVSTGGVVSSSNSINIPGRTIVVNDASLNPGANPTSCTNSGITSLLSLKMDDPAKNPTVFYLENCAVWKIVGSGAPIRMTSPNLQVLSLTFTNLTGANNGGSVRINMTMSNVNASSSPSYINTSKTYTTTATVKSWGGN